MASTITIQNTVTWAQGYLFSQPLALGAANEPAITIANVVKQAILGPPFRWRWNRKVPAAVTLSQGVQDYQEAYADFGFLEKAWIGGITPTKEIEEISFEPLPVETTQGRPDRAICAQLDDNAGNITFRVTPAPDNAATYTLQVMYQQKAALISALAGTWAPIPDEDSYLYQYGFLGLALAWNKDPRAPEYTSRFLSHLLGHQGGLSEMQKNIFLGKWLSTAMEIGAGQMRTQMGVQGRAQ